MAHISYPFIDPSALQNGSRLFLGAPGFENWKGTLLELNPYKPEVSYFEEKIHNILPSPPLTGDVCELCVKNAR